VKFQRPIEAADTYGEAVATWQTVLERYASVEPLSGRETEQARAVVATATHRVRTLFVSGVTPKWRLLFGSRILHIGSVLNPEEANEELELLVTEQV
jgi:SPP1 family predicted phage head-tail adaptor